MLEGILAYIGIGSNLSDSLQKCREAVEKLSCVSGMTIESVSSFYRTQPVISDSNARDHGEELKTQDWFVNAVLEILTTLSPRGVLRALQDVENSMGRVRTFAGAPRIIDLDLLLYGQEIICDADLIVPHPEMHKRLFVLEPLCEIASFVIHPAFGVSMRGLKERVDDKNIVEIYKK